MGLKSNSSACAIRIESAYAKEAARERLRGIKCASTAKKLRSFGGVYAANGYYINAVEMFNQALCVAPPETSILGILFANRGNAFFNMGLYDECLDCFKLALDNNYPDRLRKELGHRISICEDLITQNRAKSCGTKRQKFTLRLSYPSNPRVPAVINGMHVEENSDFGRHVIADMDLEVGDVICIEEAFVKVIQPQQRFNRCTNCLKEVPHLLFPCKSCTNAMYCCASCEDIAWDQFHKYECPISDELIKLKLDSGRLALRTFLIAMHLFNYKITALEQYIRQNRCQSVTGFDLDHRNLCKRKQFLAFYNGYADDSHSPKELVIAGKRCAITLAALLGEYTAYAPQMRCLKNRNYIINLLQRFIAINSNNCYEIGSPSPTDERIPSCLGLFLCMSMAAHSCSGNVTRLRVEGMRQMWVVNRPILKGSQIFDNYGSFFLTDSKAERQKRCLMHYGFECLCEACRFDFPQLEDLPEKEGVPYLAKSCVSEQFPLTMERASAELKLLRNYITKYDGFFPCAQLRSAENQMVKLFKQITNDTILETRLPQFFSTTSMVPFDEFE